MHFVEADLHQRRTALAAELTAPAYDPCFRENLSQRLSIESDATSTCDGKRSSIGSDGKAKQLSTRDVDAEPSERLYLAELDAALDSIGWVDSI